MFGGDTRDIPWPLAGLCVGLAALHGVAALQNRSVHSPAPMVSPPPGHLARELLAFGDHQFLYRVMAVQLQNTGDGAGRVTPISQYNYDYVVGWLNGLQSLDSRANYHFILAARYFSYTSHKDDLRRIVDFLVVNATRDPERHWFWLAQAVELSDHRLGDTERALQISLRLSAYDFDGLPSWVWLFPAVLYEKLGRNAEALAFITRVSAEKEARFTQPQKNWIEEITHRLKSEVR